MRRNLGKSVSNLDLKLLDVKFIAINDNQIYLTEALQSVRRERRGELPSLLRMKDNQKSSIEDETTILNKWEKQSPKNNDRFTQQTSDQTDFSILGNLTNNNNRIQNEQSQSLSLYNPTNNNKPPISSSHQQKSIFANNNSPRSEQQQQAELLQIKQQIRLRRSQQYSHHNQPNTNMLLHSQSRAQLQQKELQKYRRKIQLIKKENQFIHNQISLLYRNKIIDQNKEQYKKVKKIQPFKIESLKTQPEGKNPFAMTKQIHQNSSQNIRINHILDSQKLKSSNQSTSQSKLSLTQKKNLSPLISQKANFYENLTEDSPFKQQLEEIHKKMISSNFHKNFEQYLNSANKRVPEFIKKLRN